MNNQNDQSENLWTLSHQVSDEWAEGRVEVSSEGDKEYQVSSYNAQRITIHKILNQIKTIFENHSNINFL